VPERQTLRGLAGAAALVLASLLIGAPAVQARNLGTLDAQATSQGHVIEDAAGSAYIAWTDKAPSSEAAETVKFCKIPAGATCAAPITLPSAGAGLSVESPSGAFPVFGAGSTVYVVAPRYTVNDVVLYTSTNAGVSFGPGQVIPMADSSKTNPTEVFLSGSEFLLGAYNAGLGFSAFNTSETLGSFSLSEPGPGGVAASAMGLDSSGNPVEAYYNLSSPQYTIDFVRYTGSGSKTEEKDWTLESTVANGYEPRLAGGPSGLLMVSQDFTSPSEAYASAIDVRKFNGSSFGGPVQLANETNSDLYAGGTIAQSPSGHVAVVWPRFPVGGESVMDLFSSSSAGSSFGGPAAVATLGSGYEDQVNAQLSYDNSGDGWLTFLDAAGLQLANLETGTGAAPVVSSKIGSDVVSFAGPKGCVKPGQTITLKLSVKSAKRKRKVVLKIYQVIFSIDGKVFKKLVRESVRKTGKVDTNPFVATIKQSYAAGSKHTAAAQAFISEKHGKHASRTLRLNFSVCS
jgi:hypothetical protein